MDEEKLKKAGEIHKQVKAFAKGFIKKDTPLLEIAEKIEEKVRELGGENPFPINLSMNEIAAHYTPSYNDETKTEGLLKVDFGVHIDGWAVDGAFTVDLENDERNKRMIETAQKALQEGANEFKYGNPLSNVGKKIEERVTKEKGLHPIVNLCGHNIDQYELHAGVVVPNIDTQSEEEIEEGIYAIEPFVSTGKGRVHDGKPSEIYILTSDRNVRSPIAREVLKLILEEYKTFPFASRWIIKKIGTKALFGLRELEKNGNIHRFKQLVEDKGVKIAQEEFTVLVKKNETITLNS